MLECALYLLSFVAVECVRYMGMQRLWSE